MTDKKCTNPNHDWAAHRKWKIEKKAAGAWGFADWFDDLIDPPPRRGQTREQADRSVRAFVLRTIIFGGGFVLMIAANVMCSTIERAVL